MNTPHSAATADSFDAVSERAASFFARRRFGPWSDADQVELDAWLAEETSHYVAWLRVESIAAQTERMASVPAFRAVPKSNTAAPDNTARLRYRRFAIPLLAAASVALFAALGIPFVSSLMQPPPDRSDSTDVGGRTLLTFADHTQIELDTDTAIRFRMTGEERTVWLDRGEAWFRVSHDASRPFNVIVGKHRVTDLGTEFLVRRGADDMEVALLNGRATLSAEGVQTATLGPGDEALATPVSMSVTRKTPQQLSDELAWRRGMLVFRNTKLADVVKEFNRYNTRKLVIADSSIAGESFSAELRADDYEDFLNLAQTLLDLRVDRQGNDILISRAQRKAKRAAP